jgi:hypothetical protein
MGPVHGTPVSHATDGSGCTLATAAKTLLRQSIPPATAAKTLLRQSIPPATAAKTLLRQSIPPATAAKTLLRQSIPPATAAKTLLRRSTNTSTSPNHCGRCHHPCASKQRCLAGTCATDGCPAGQTSCAGACVDLQRDPNHCGACGRRCNAGESCSAGRCVPSAGMCPPSCGTTADCAPCHTAGDPGNYCCISNLCLYMTGACPSPSGDGSVGGDDAAGDTGAGDGRVD